MTTTDQPTRNEQVARRWVEELLNRGNVDAVDELIAPAIEEHPLFYNPHRPAWVLGSSTFERVKLNAGKSVFGMTNAWTTIDQTVAAGDKVVVVGTTTGTANGKQITYNVIFVIRVVDEKIAEEWYLFDRLGIWQQFGVVPETAELRRQAGLVT